MIISIYNESNILLINKNEFKSSINLILNILKFEKYKNQFFNFNFVNNNTILDINKRFINHNYITDVIAFDYRPCYDSKDVIAELFIGYEVAINRSIDMKVDFSFEIFLYIVHGILHVAGFNDIKTLDKNIMKNMENNLIDQLSFNFNIRDIINYIKKSK